MKQWIQRQIDNGFSDFKGLSIAARLPLKDALVNELLTEVLRDMASPAPEPVAPVSVDTVDMRTFIKFIEKAEVHASDGVIVIDVAVKV